MKPERTPLDHVVGRFCDTCTASNRPAILFCTFLNYFAAKTHKTVDNLHLKLVAVEGEKRHKPAVQGHRQVEVPDERIQCCLLVEWLNMK